MTGRIPEKFVDDLLTRIDIVDVIDSRVPLRRAGKDYKACCPFHEEKTPSFTVSQDKQFYHCFGCGVHGSAIGFLMEYEHMSFPEAVEELAGRAGLSVPRDSRGASPLPAQADDLAAVSEILVRADRYYRRQLREHPQAQEAVAYLKGRGLSGEIAAEFGLGFAPDGWDNLACALGSDPASQQALVAAGLVVKKENGGFYDRFRGRIMFPIHDYRGRVVGFGGRVLGQGEPKYLNSPETPLFHKGRELYGLFRARDALRRENRALVVEGYMDVVALAQFGLDYAVATLGTATTRDHLERLFRFAPEVVFCFDGDRAGRDAAWRALGNALPALHDGRQVSFLFLPEGEDPDTLIRKEGLEEFAARLQVAVSLPDYLFQTLAADIDLGRLDGRARLVELARPLLSNLPQGALRELMSARLAEISLLAPQNLSKLLLLEGSPAPTRRSTAAQRPPQRNTGGVPSLAQTALALLVQHPRLGRLVGDPQPFLALDGKGIPLLVALMRLLNEQPDLNTGSIIEHFRDSEYLHHIGRLAAREHPMHQQDVDAEFVGLLHRLRCEANRQQIERLSGKERAAGLNSAEKSELVRLLREKRELEHTKFAPRP
ncbi:MAG: DNA primase [Acidiferrobacterales bacterium]